MKPTRPTDSDQQVASMLNSSLDCLQRNCSSYRIASLAEDTSSLEVAVVEMSQVVHVGYAVHAGLDGRMEDGSLDDQTVDVVLDICPWDQISSSLNHTVVVICSVGLDNDFLA